MSMVFETPQPIVDYICRKLHSPEGGREWWPVTTPYGNEPARVPYPRTGGTRIKQTRPFLRSTYKAKSSRGYATTTSGAGNSKRPAFGRRSGTPTSRRTRAASVTSLEYFALAVFFWPLKSSSRERGRARIKLNSLKESRTLMESLSARIQSKKLKPSSNHT